MDETFWTVEFKGIAGASSGVLMFTKGKIFGGDCGNTFTGNYDGDLNVKGNIRVHPFAPGFNVMGMHSDFELEFTGTLEEKTMTVTGSVTGHPRNKFTAQLTKVTELPSVRPEWAATAPDELTTSGPNSELRVDLLIDPDGLRGHLPEPPVDRPHVEGHL